MVGNDEEFRKVPFPFLADTRDEGAQRAVHQAIALQHRRMERILEVGDAVHAWEHNKDEAPRLGGGIEPGARNRPIERGICPHVMSRGAERSATERQTVCAGTEAPGQRRTDRDALRDQVEQGRRRRDIPVQPAPLYAAIAPGGTPLLAPASGCAGPIEPANAGNADAAGIPAEQERDIRHTGRRWKHRRAGCQATALDDPTREIGEVAASEQLPQHIATGAVDEYENRSARAVRHQWECRTRKRPRHLPRPLVSCQAITTRP